MELYEDLEESGYEEFNFEGIVDCANDAEKIFLLYFNNYNILCHM